MEVGKRHWIIFYLVCLLLTQSALGQTSATEGCTGIDSVKIVKVDDRARRAFVEARLNEINTLANAQRILLLVQTSLNQCRPSWGNSWSASFFSESKYAGYKDDRAIEAFVRDGSWFRAYVGEYECKTQKLTLNPTDPKKVKFLKVRVP